MNPHSLSSNPDTDIITMLRRYFRQQDELGAGEWYVTPAPETSESNTLTLTGFYQQIKDCQQCGLGRSRTNFVFGTGSEEADIMFIGEAPGRDEDLQGKPFVGRAGQLLTKIIEAIQFQREDVYIANILKCRPPENRDPLPEEAEICQPYLDMQIRLIKPMILCALGRVAAQTLLRTTTPLGKLRGQFYDFHGTKLIVTYHPAALLRNPNFKRPTWEDMQMLRREYDRLK